MQGYLLHEVVHHTFYGGVHSHVPLRGAFNMLYAAVEHSPAVLLQTSLRKTPADTCSP